MSNLKKRKQHTENPLPKKKAKLDKNEQTQFQLVNTSLVLSVPPIFASNPRDGVHEMLDSMVMRYIPALRGVVLAHSNLEFLKPTASITADCPFLVCHIRFDATVWSPHVRMNLVGKINLCSPDHVSLLVHRTFNVSIPRHHIPTREWEFEHDSADEDRGEDEEGEEHPGGRWVHKKTGKRLGGENGYLEFVVIGLTVANEMLSLVGSLQPDPFSPEHAVVPPNPPKTAAKTAVQETVVESEMEDGSESESESEEEAVVKTKTKR